MLSFEEIIIPLFALTVLFFVPAMIGLTAVIMWFKSRNRLYKTIEDAVDKNAPPEVIQQLVALTESKESREEKSSPIKHLTDAAAMFAIGVAFIVFFNSGGPTGVIFPGVFLTLFGLGKFGIAAYAAKNKKTQRD